jgi:hypothetical protein
MVASAALGLSLKVCAKRDQQVINTISAVVAYYYSAVSPAPWVFPVLIFFGGPPLQTGKVDSGRL